MTSGQPLDDSRPQYNHPTHPAHPAHPAHPEPHAQAYQQSRQVHGQPLSSSTSPQLANVLSHTHNGQTLPEPTHVLPSPAPSEDAALDAASIAANTTRPPSAFTLPSNVYPGQIFGPATKPPRRPMATGGSPMLANKRPRPSIDQQAQLCPPNHTPQQQISTRPPQQPPAERSQFEELVQQPPPNRLPVNTSVPLSGQHVSPANSGVQTMWPTKLLHLRGFCAAQLAGFKDRIGGFQHPSTLDSQRIRALEMAVAEWDWHYVITHMFYCLLTTNKISLPEAISNSKHVSDVEKFLSDVLDTNDKLRPVVRKFFTEFPMPINQLLENDPAQLQIDVNDFLNLMSKSGEYYTLKKKFGERDIPPSVHEMVYDLGIKSRQFQRIVFTATIRRLWTKWGLKLGIEELSVDFESEAIAILQENQMHFYNRLQQGQDGMAEWATETQHLIDLFTGLREKYSTKTYHALQTIQTSLQQTAVPPTQPPPTEAPYPQQHPTLFSSGYVNPYSVAPQLVFPTPETLVGFNTEGTLSRQHLYPIPSFDSTQAAIPRGRGRPRGRPRLTNQPRPQSPRILQHQQPHYQSQPRLQFPGPFQHAHQNLQSQREASAAIPRPVYNSLFPAPGFRAQYQRSADPSRFGLHQAHLRDAILRMRTKVDAHPSYLYLQSFLRGPQHLAEAEHKVERWVFNISPGQFASIPKDEACRDGSPPLRFVDEKSILLRLRCAKWNDTTRHNEHIWAVTDTSWIPYSYFTLNGKSLEQRLKLHYGKDLPIDLTHLVKQGENTLEIAILRHSKDKHFSNYRLAIEILGIRTHANFTNHILQNNRLSPAITKKSIISKLAPTPLDDDLSLVSSNLTITVVDAFSSKMCNTPVRSRACDHFECFDLATFLETRNRNGDCTVADHWKCPVCNGDARPKLLVVDGFMEEVCGELRKEGLEGTRAIVVGEDGKWKAKIEVKEGVAEYEEEEEGEKGKGGQVEVIELE